MQPRAGRAARSPGTLLWSSGRRHASAGRLMSQSDAAARRGRFVPGGGAAQRARLAEAMDAPRGAARGFLPARALLEACGRAALVDFVEAHPLALSGAQHHTRLSTERLRAAALAELTRLTQARAPPRAPALWV
jgi:hypothetical protein